MSRIIRDGRYARPPVTILVATSGDTGGAVAAAFHRRPGIRVVVLFPDGRVSPRQQHQLTCWGDNVVSLAVRGEFDDCQRLAKEAFADATSRQAHRPVLGQQHQRRPTAAPGRLLCAGQPGALPADGPGTELHRADRQSRQWLCLRLGAAHGPAHRPDRPGHQCQHDDRRFPGDGPVAATPDGGDTRLGDGCRQSEQHGTAAGSLRGRGGNPGGGQRCPGLGR